MNLDPDTRLQLWMDAALPAARVVLWAFISLQLCLTVWLSPPCGRSTRPQTQCSLGTGHL